MKKLLACALLSATLAGTAVLTSLPTEAAQNNPARTAKSSWRYFGGRWNYYDSTDQRWYYTDGQHWFYHEKDAWRPYGFDKGYGRTFERGDYRTIAEKERDKVRLPSHQP